MGDASEKITAAAGEDLELECIATGGNPPAKLTWFTNGVEITSGHVQKNDRQGKTQLFPALNADFTPDIYLLGSGQRTYSSFSRLTLPVSKEDNGATISCRAEHPVLDEPLSTEESLTIHCK